MSEFTQPFSMEDTTTHPGDVSFFIGRGSLLVPDMEFYRAGESMSPADNVFAFMCDLHLKNHRTFGKVPRDEVLTLPAADGHPAVQIRSFYSGLTDVEAQARLPFLGEYKRMVDELAALPQDATKHEYDSKGRVTFHTEQHPDTVRKRFLMREFLKTNIPDVLGIQGVETFLVNIDKAAEGFPEKFRQMDHSLLVSHTYFLGDESMFGLPTKNPSTGWRTYVYQGDSDKEPTFLFLNRQRQTDNVDLATLYGDLETQLR